MKQFENMEHKIQDDLDLEDEVEHVSRTAEDREFDVIVSTLEEVVMDERFQEFQNNFCERNCDKFEESKENKLEYTPIFHEYCDSIENMIETKLKEKIPGYSIAKMDSLLRAHKDELAGEAFDMLTSVWDFLEFKDLMLSYRKAKTPAPPASGSSGSAAGGLDLSISGGGLSIGGTGLSIGGTGLSVGGKGLSVAGRRA